jgi:hypothetical protein
VKNFLILHIFSEDNGGEVTGVFLFKKRKIYNGRNGRKRTLSQESREKSLLGCQGKLLLHFKLHS